MGQDPLAPPTAEGTTNASVSPAVPQLPAPEAVPARVPWVSLGGLGGCSWPAQVGLPSKRERLRALVLAERRAAASVPSAHLPPFRTPAARVLPSGSPQHSPASGPPLCACSTQTLSCVTVGAG